MLRAIAVYDLNDKNEFNRIQAVEKPGTVFSPNDDLKYFEQNTLPLALKKPDFLSAKKIYSDLSDTEGRYYYARFVSTVDEAKTVLTRHLHVLISSRVLVDPEPYYLLVNVDNVDQKKVKFDLSAILRNPTGYIGRDMCPKELREKIEKTKVELQNTKAALEERDEKVKTSVQLTERLFDKSVVLLSDADEIRDNNSCCGGWARNPFRR